MQQVALQVSGPVKSVRMFAGAREVAVLTAPPWRATVDFGDELTPRELTAVGFDAEGREIARATQVINLPRPAAELNIVVDRDRVTLRWSHLMRVKPQRATITADGKPLAVDAAFGARLPELDREVPHVIAAEMRFEDGLVARREFVIESVHSDSVGTELTPLAVRETAPAHPATWDGCLIATDGRAVRTAAVEKPRALMIMVHDVDPRELSVAQQLKLQINRGSGAFRRLTLLDPGTSARILWPIAKRFGGEEQAVSILFEQSNDLDGSIRGALDLLVARYGEDVPDTVPRQFADAVAVAGLNAITAAQRRAVVFVLSSNRDQSHHAPAAVRRYLESIGVPLFVWSLSGPRPELAATWGSVDDISSLPKLASAVKRVRGALDEQRIAWVDVDPLAALRLKANERCGIETVARVTP